MESTNHDKFQNNKIKMQLFRSNPATTEPNFVCPQQPDLILPFSRLNDGICDCCDGSDEHPDKNHCIDNCDEVLKVERERQAKIQSDFLAGSKKREHDLSQFEKLRATKITEAYDLDQKIEVIRAEIEDIEGTQIVGLKETYVLSRVATMKDLVAGHSMATDLLTGLKLEELEALLVHLCQIAGEISKSDKRDNGESTCLALRVAALDLGLTWGEQENYDDGTTETTFHNATDAEIVQIVFENAAEESEGQPPLRWRKSPPKKNGRRRLDEADEEFRRWQESLPQDPKSSDFEAGDEVHDDYLKHDDEYFMNDDEYGEYIEESEEDLISSSEEKPVFGKQYDFIGEIRTSLFSTTRATFLKESQEILDGIDKILVDVEASDNNEESSESDNSQPDDNHTNEDDGSGKDTIDPISYTTLRNDLIEKRAIIEHGLQWGASAKFLLGASSFSSRRVILERLLIGTIFYGQVSTLHVWQILQAVLPEYNVLSQEFMEAERICASAWAGNCPPKHVYREPGDGGADATASPDNIEYPPSFLLKVASAFCDEESSRMAKRGDIVCHRNSSDDDIDNIIESLLSLPSREGHSYFGYEVPARRNEKIDPFRTMFDPILKLPIDVQGLQSLEDRRDAKETELGNFQHTIKALWKEIGGKSGNALGRNGEFLSIANQCFEIDSGKYTYELCVFGKASQKDSGSQTNLGKFDNFEYVEEGKNTRVLKWIDGAKCWNGPRRSATIYMTCGLDHKLVSANEPDTCRYVFEMESYLACDEEYKLSVGL